jgi:hypothetical protein
MKTNLPPYRFRSPLLRPAPSVRRWGRAGVVSLRLMGISLSVLILITLILLIRLKILPATFFAMLYWLHDFVYLGIKGYTFTLFFPWSLVWWLFLGGTLLLIIASFLMDRSFMLGPHRAILKYLAHQRMAYPFLYRATRFLARWSISSTLLRGTLRYEREELALRIWGNPKRDQLSFEIAALTILILQIELLFQKPNILFLANLWEETLLTIRLQPAHNQSKELLQNALLELRIILPDLLKGQPVQQRHVHLFDPDILLRDLAYLAQSTWPDWELFPGTVPEADPAVLAGRSCEQRRLLIESAIRDLNGPALSSLQSSPSGWSLSLYVAFHCAIVTGNLEQGVAYYDAVDTLVLMLATLPEGKNSLRSMDTLNMPPVFPVPLQAQMAAILQRARFSGSSVLVTTLKTLAGFEESPVTEADLAFVEARLTERDYWQAGGPIAGPDGAFESGGKR